MARKKIGELLLERSVITLEQLNAALAHQRQYGQRLGAALVAKGFLTEQQLLTVLGEALSLQVVDLDSTTPDWSAVHLLRPRFCEAHDLFPIGLDDQKGRRTLTVAMSDPLNLPAIEEIEFTTGCKVVPVLATHGGIQTSIRKFHYRNTPNERVQGDRMEIVRPGGGTELIDTSTAEPVDDADLLPLVEEVTERTALADLIQKRDEQRRQKAAQRAAAAAPAPAQVASRTQLDDDLGFLMGVEVQEPSEEKVERLERKFWALMRILAKKGILSRDEFLAQLDD